MPGNIRPRIPGSGGRDGTRARGPRVYLRGVNGGADDPPAPGLPVDGAAAAGLPVDGAAAVSGLPVDGAAAAPVDGAGADTAGPTRPAGAAARIDVALPAMPGPGALVGHYVLMREIGRGGMGQVFLAKDVKLDRQVAIKFVAVEGPAAVSRFMAEARVTARCTHPNIVVIHEIGEHAGIPYMVLEYVEGDSVLGLLQRGPLSPGRVVTIMTQVARALAFAHSRGIAHRDLKPANVLIALDGTAKIVDFGIAKPLDDEGLRLAFDLDETGAVRDVTMPGELIGTLHYIAPEQVRRDPIDDRLDLWAFGVTMYQMLAGRRPLQGLSRSEIIEHLRDLDRPVPRLDDVRPGLPAGLVELVHRCLAKRIDQRPPSASDVVAALEALPVEVGARSSAELPAVVIAEPGPPSGPETITPLGPPRSPGPPPEATEPVPPLTRRWWLTVAAIALLVAATIFFIVRGGDARRRADTDPGAAARVAELVAELDRLEGQGARAEADRLLGQFLTEEPDQLAVAIAWLERGDRELRRGELDAAMASYSNAYARASERGVQRRALVALGALYLERWEWDRLAAAMDVYDGQPGDRDVDGEAQRDRMLLATRAPEASRSSSPPTAATARALLTGRPTTLDLGPFTTADVDGDGVQELLAIEAGAVVVRAADTLAERSRTPAAGLTDLRCAGRDRRGGWAVMAPLHWSTAGWQVVPLDGSPPAAVEATATDLRARCYAIDLDGDGGDELYVVGYNRLLRVARDPAGAWTSTEVPTGSQVWDVIGGDLDGDGQRELVVAVGEWRAYDVRLLRADAGGALRVVDRLRLGVVTNLADIGGGRVAALEQDIYPSKRYLPADRTAGVSPGLYLLSVTRDGFDTKQPPQRIALDRPLTGTYDVGPMRVADLDGDGRRDLVAPVRLDADRTDLVIMLGQPKGGFETRVISAIEPLAVLAGDGDRADELLVRIAGEPAPWLLGAGTTAVPRLRFPPLPVPPPSLATGGDPAIAGAWRRAEELARIGRVEAAADALKRIAALSRSPAVKTDALRRAAALLRARGLSAAAVLEALAQLARPGSRARVDALLAAIDERVAAVELAEAARLFQELDGAAALLTPAERARLAALRDELATRRQVIFDGGELGSGWRIADPAFVHVVPGARKVSVETLVPGPVAALPLTRGDEVVTVAITAQVTRTEWAGSLVFRVGPRDRSGPGAIEVEIGGRGGGGIYQRAFACRGRYPSVTQRHADMPDTDAPVTVELELAVLPARGRGRCTITVDGRRETTALDVGATTATDWELSIGGGVDADLTSATAQLASIVVAGVTPAAASPGPLDAAALALAGHRADEARALLAKVEPALAATWPARRLAVMALDEAGHPGAAADALRAALAAPAAVRPSLRELALLVRVRDGQFAPVVRAALRRRVALVLAEAWSIVAAHDLHEPRVRTALIRDLAGLPAASDDTRDATLSLLGFEGEALLAAGRPDDGRRALIDALRLFHDRAAPAVHDRAERIAYLLAVDAAARGDVADAERWARRSLDVSNQPELAADMLLLRPETRRLAAGPGWERVRALGRTVVEEP